MKIKNIIIASALIIFAASCRSNSEDEAHGREHGTEQETEAHGHAHDTESHGHAHDEEGNHEQEEFIVENDSLEQETDSTHIHDDGEVHHDH